MYLISSVLAITRMVDSESSYFGAVFWRVKLISCEVKPRVRITA
jgi:hypothetical protein